MQYPYECLYTGVQFQTVPSPSPMTFAHMCSYQYKVHVTYHRKQHYTCSRQKSLAFDKADRSADLLQARLVAPHPISRNSQNSRNDACD